MKVALHILLAVVAACPMPVLAQGSPLQYYAHRQLANPAAMSEATTVEAALYGQYCLYGFEGAPKDAALQVTVPRATSSRNNYYFAGSSAAEDYKMFFGLVAYGASIGAYSEYNAALSYAYQVRLSQRMQLAFGVAMGASVSGRGYGSMPESADDPSLLSSNLWQLHAQAGVYLHGEKYYMSVYSPTAVNKSVFLQSGYSTAVGGSADGGYYGDASQKKNRWEVHAQAGYAQAGRGKSEKMTVQGSTVYTVNGLLGVGVAWQNPLNLAALAQLNIGGVKISYAYQITDLNVNILQHEIILKISFSKKENLY